MAEHRSDVSRGERHATSTRGFLFADLRGYTAFVERHGARRAADVLDRYRSLVRAAVAEFDGAEIRTEGDSFYVVFDSASAAIECGLRIVTGADATARDDPSTAYHVGVGVHAGETIETAEGYVGSAVNTAARICAKAGPNQVLVSSTVRTLTAGVVAASFVGVGRRRLKGLTEPIELYRAVPESGLPARQFPRAMRATSGLVALAGVGVVGAVAVALFILSQGGFAGGLTGRPLASITPSASRQAPIGSIAGTPAPSSIRDRSAPVGAFPNPEEEALLALVDQRHRDDCERGLARDAPGIWFRDSLQGATGAWLHEIVPHQGSITCPIGRSIGPDALWLWHVDTATQRGLPVEPVELVRNHGGRFRGFPGGDGCLATHHALEDWTFGGASGLLLCYSPTGGDAIIEWAYDDAPVLARAVREDGDMAILLAWWMENARFGP